MAMIHFAILRRDDHWAIDENGQVSGEYISREAAFEAAAGAASNLLKVGDGIAIVVEEPAVNESGLGTVE
jgi:hypothetical protein